MSSQSFTKLSYDARIHNFENPAARRLLETMERKKTNLCVSVDVTKAAEVLQVVRLVGASCCMVKTHIDIIEDFTLSLTEELLKLSEELDFVIFEDRKFADIGNTVSLQYSSGVHHIASWSHFTNAHPLPGPGIITGLSKVGAPLGRGLLLLAEMSSKGNLLETNDGAYTRQAVDMARDTRGDGFVVGFIAMRRVDEVFPSTDSSSTPSDFLVLTPGVSLASSGDSMGQQYRTPHQVIYDSGCDVIIVGRGIYGKMGADGGDEVVKAEAERYRAEGWAAYQKRIGEA